MNKYVSRTQTSSVYPPTHSEANANFRENGSSRNLTWDLLVMMQIQFPLWSLRSLQPQIYMTTHIYTQARLLQSLNLLLHTVDIFPGLLSSHFSLFYTIISHQILSSVPHSGSYASKQNAAERGNQIHITFAFRASGHKWMVSGSEKRQHFHLSFLCLSYTRRGSTCKLATKGEVENNYGSDAPERNESIA